MSLLRLKALAASPSSSSLHVLPSVQSLLPSLSVRHVVSYKKVKDKSTVFHDDAHEAAKVNKLMADVHGTIHGKMTWRNRPLFGRKGERIFRNGMEASEMLYEEAVRRDPQELDYLESVKTFLDTLSPVFDRFPKYAWVMKQLLEPERLIQFRVPWVDDTGNVRVNRGYRVQYSSALGPYMGTLRFHRSCNYSAVKFLGFENVFRNALMGKAGGAAGGSDFNPITKSEPEIMRFCQSFMTELANYIGPHTDTPGPGIGVGQKEIGYLFGQYKRLQQEHYWADINGVLGGGHMWFPKITGSGIAMFAEKILNDDKKSLKDRTCLFSGSGNVALHTANKVLEYGGIPIGFSDTSGYIIEKHGFTKEKLKILMAIKSNRFARVGNYLVESTSAEYIPHGSSESLWKTIPCDYAFPSSIQNEITLPIVKALLGNGCQGIFEGAHMPCTSEVVRHIREKGIVYAPSKAINGALLAFTNLQGVDIEGKEVIDRIIKKHVDNIYKQITETAEDYKYPKDLLVGTNISSFLKVAEAMVLQGAV